MNMCICVQAWFEVPPYELATATARAVIISLVIRGRGHHHLLVFGWIESQGLRRADHFTVLSVELLFGQVVTVTDHN